MSSGGAWLPAVKHRSPSRRSERLVRVHTFDQLLAAPFTMHRGGYVADARLRAWPRALP